MGLCIEILHAICQKNRDVYAFLSKTILCINGIYNTLKMEVSFIFW